MKTTFAPQTELRTEVIFRHLRRLVRETGVSVEDYSEDVLRVWMERTSAEARISGHDFRVTTPVFDRMSANGQKIRRWMSSEIKARPSIDVEECLVLGLPEPYQSDCRRDLARRYGLMDVPLPDEAGGDHVSDIAAMGDMAMRFGGLMQALAPILDDGQIDGKDAPLIPHAMDECEKLIAKAIVVRQHLQRFSPGTK